MTEGGLGEGRIIPESPIAANALEKIWEFFAASILAALSNQVRTREETETAHLPLSRIGSPRIVGLKALARFAVAAGKSRLLPQYT